MAIQHRKIGSQGLAVSAIGFGAMGLTAFYGDPVKEEHGISLMKRAVEIGINFFDTAESYNSKPDVNGLIRTNESLLGKAVKEIGRNRVIIATKHKPGGIEGKSCSSKSELRQVIRNSCENSLKQLGVNYIDLYYLHRMYPPPHTIEDVMTCFKELVLEGKIRYVGLSEAPPEYIRRAHIITPISAVQQEWSLIARDLEASGSIVDTCRELGIGIVAYSPLARGFLAGAYQVSRPQDNRIRVPYFNNQNWESNVQVVGKIGAMANQMGFTLGQLSLSWVMNQGDDVVAIPGTTTVQHLQENLQAAQLKLEGQTIQKLDFISKNFQGARMSEADMQGSFRHAKWD
jgi:aryl-alcohol dehydrogenase-like predicted oxidoreductase